MTDTSTAKLPTEHALVQVCRYKAGPPLDLVEPGDTFATTKEEEWVSKKKTELTTTRQIETRVKRQVVLEDGKVVDDSGPIVTTNTHEDTEKQEHSQTELRKLGEDEPDQAAAIEGAPTDGVTLRDWVAVPNSDRVVKEVKGHRVVTREETEERRETEDVQHLGDITDEDFLAAVHSGKSDLREVLKENGTNIVSIGPRVVHESIKTKKTTDTEDTANVSSVTPDGKLVTETKKTTEHEEVKDEELPEDEPDSNAIKENSQRYLKTKDQEFVEYLADGVKIGQEMRYKAETMEGERHGDPEDPADWDSLSTRIRRTNRRQQVAGRVQIQKPKGIEEPQIGPVVDRKDALTKKPLDFDAEEETRKAETSKWLENHFGSESTRSSRDSLDQITEAPTTTKSFFSVTIKSAPTRVEQVRPFVATTTRVYSPSPEPVQVTPIRNGYYQGITEWSDRKHVEILKPHAPYPIYPTDRPHATQSPYHHLHEPVGVTPTPPERKRLIERRQRSSQDSNRYDSGYRTHSRNEMSRTSVEEPAEEPPPDYSPPPPSPPPPGVHQVPKKPYQRTRFATDTVKAKPSGNIIGQSIRKLVGKIRSVSAERKAKQRAKRSPSPQTTYQQYNVIDNNIPSSTSRRSRDSDASMTDRKSRNSPVQKYYLGEDPFGGSIYGRENKYDGVRPARAGRPRPHRRESNPSEDEQRSHSTLGRFSKSASRLGNGDTRDYSRSVQTLPRNSESTRRRSPPRNNAPNTINVSIINTVGGSRPLANGGPAKPARTYKSHLARSKSFNVHTTSTEGNLYKSNPQLHRLDEHPIGLKSPAIVSLISRSTKDLSDEKPYQSRIRDTRSFKPDARNNQTVDRSRFNQSETQKKTFLKGLKERAPDLYKTLNSDDEDPRKPWHPQTFSTPVKHSHYNQNIYEPPTRLIDPYPVIRRGSNSTDDYSETYHTTTRSDDPKRPSVTDTVKIISKKTIPAKDGRKLQTIESTETKSITRSRMRGEPTLNGSKMNNGGVVIEVKNYRN